MKSGTIVGVLVLVIGIVGALVFNQRSPQTVSVTYAQKGDLMGRFLASGRVESLAIEVSTESFGRLAKLNVEESQRVSKGDLLAVMEDPDREAMVKNLQAKVATALSYREEAAQQLLLKQHQTQSDLAGAQARRRQAAWELAGVRRGPSSAQLAQAEAVIEEAKVRLAQARRERERLEQLYQQKVASQAAVEEARTNEQLALAARTKAVNQLTELKEPPREKVEAARQSLALADVNVSKASNADLEVSLLESRLRTRQLELESMQSELAQAEARLARSRLRAPTDGVVAKVHKEPGELLYMGNAVVSLVRPEELWVEANVVEQDASNVHQDQKVTLRLPSAPERELSGIVEEVSPTLESRDGSSARVLRIRVRIEGKPEGLRPGLEADVDGTRVLAKDVWMVPRGVVHKEGELTYVVTVKSGKVNRLPVKIGASNPETYGIEGEFDAKTPLVTLGAEKLQEGQAVKVSDG